MENMRLFFKMWSEIIRIKYEYRKDYWRYRAELEIYKQEKLKQIANDTVTSK